MEVKQVFLQGQSERLLRKANQILQSGFLPSRVTVFPVLHSKNLLFSRVLICNTLSIETHKKIIKFPNEIRSWPMKAFWCSKLFKWIWIWIDFSTRILIRKFNSKSPQKVNFLADFSLETGVSSHKNDWRCAGVDMFNWFTTTFLVCFCFT